MNHLRNATSPYLRQHADNPVDWEEWGERAFRRARDEDKPILLSIGYAACHWCHVMAHESFENEGIARQVNDGFVAIKVDREERPDLDQIYQHAVQALGVSGGWPLTVFLRPDGRPFYGGTYFPPDDRYGRPGFPRVLAGVRDAWEKRRGEVDANAEELTRALDEIERPPPDSGLVITDPLGAAGEWLLRRVDPDHGGFGGAPKFPNTMALDVLLRWSTRARSSSPRSAVLYTYGRMAEGGLYDQVGGGFHRYSVDARWHVPHFEKMLYDNALLASGYVRLWQATKVPWARHVADELLTYLTREMRAPTGAFFASTDADSVPPGSPDGHAEEGAFFAWREAEIREAIGDDASAAAAMRYGVRTEGNWEDGKNVLFLAASEADVAARIGRPLEETQRLLASARATLFEARERRPRPFRDEKILTSWNALAVSAFARAGAAFGSHEWTSVAASAAEAVLAGAWLALPGREGRRLLRAPLSPNHEPLLGTVDDYANLAEACVGLWEATLDRRWLEVAAELADGARTLFLDDDGTVFLTGRDAESLVHRPRSLHDQSLPAGSAVLAEAWLLLARLLGRDDLERSARSVLARHRTAMARQPFAFGAMIAAADTEAHPLDVVIAGDGPGRDELLAALRRLYLPGLATHISGPIAADKVAIDGKATAYVCRDRTCSPPITSPAALEELLAVDF